MQQAVAEEITVVRHPAAVGSAGADLPLPSLEGYTIVVPAFCVGNVSQLCADVLVATLSMMPALALDHPALVPAIGNALPRERQVEGMVPGIMTAAEGGLPCFAWPVHLAHRCYEQRLTVGA
ncbi:uncharacterized protein MONBRDRAFT_9461 [Monosiga brevicollis MX1]|uniref:Proteasome assembly chaperone 2 n=1 Tax=Monosiga brevicollis TaxID=81824 RepID=A9V382_MONBE|nr:uncharacterized protein MONBRDRAFT_9461 [Monosiga brevicollis MX1]EDQ88144.1 predicted protein [Monosiga brevicollis MX1]|eukprot:XP_001747220.1 hypothetical protein [Monosiga brevicollis MX1]